MFEVVRWAWGQQFAYEMRCQRVPINASHVVNARFVVRRVTRCHSLLPDHVLYGARTNTLAIAKKTHTLTHTHTCVSAAWVQYPSASGRTKSLLVASAYACSHSFSSCRRFDNVPVRLLFAVAFTCFLLLSTCLLRWLNACMYSLWFLLYILKCCALTYTHACWNACTIASYTGCSNIFPYLRYCFYFFLCKYFI